jgi:hypothetical protein
MARGWFFQPLYQQVHQTHNAEIITRIDYTWKDGNITVPSPTTMSAQTWANKIVSDVIGPLGPYAHRWQIGNEPNILGEGNGWTNNQITPQAYAQIYHTVRQTIKAQRPNDEVLFAPVSPGGVVTGVRWKDGNEWLAEAIDATLALPGGAIDGFSIHSYGAPWLSVPQAIAEFHDGYASQLAVIDSRSLEDVPVYITEWNRATYPTDDLALNEQTSADFLRGALLDVDAWNRTPGNHNIRSVAWFVYQGNGGWQEYSIEEWRTRGNPEGHPGDLWTALIESGNLQAGMAGTRPMADYNADAVIDEADYAAWRTSFGNSKFANAFDRDNTVSAADYVIWRKLFAAGTGGAPATVPETTTIFQLTLFVVVSSYRHRTPRGTNQPSE